MTTAPKSSTAANYPDGPGRPPGPSHRAPRRRGAKRRRNWAPHVPRRLWSRLLASVLIIVLIPVSWSVGHALTMLGGGSLSERLAEWARDHYLGPLVTFG